LPGPVVLTWFAVNLAFRLTSDLVCRGLLRLPTPGRRHEIGLAAFTFAGTAAYAALPALFLIQGEPTALIAAMAMSAAIALSAGSELTASRPVALAALGATAGALITGFLFTPGHDGLPASAA
ncbi:MAG TPA: hypothetical protein PKB04_00390, partial [Phenylobacterium sp.]|nr:hypothetical protein [Phenylobacterium sp.]